MSSIQLPLLLSGLKHCPELYGLPISVAFLPALSAHRGKLLSGQSRGAAIHATSFLRKRQIVLDTKITLRKREFSRIFVHELFHFAWLRLGNSRRKSYEAVLDNELRERVSGELGWSAELRKLELRPRDRRQQTRRWREYVCESFCDSAAWLFTGAGSHDEFTLPRRSRLRRRRWFEESNLTLRIPV